MFFPVLCGTRAWGQRQDEVDCLEDLFVRENKVFGIDRLGGGFFFLLLCKLARGLLCIPEQMAAEVGSTNERGETPAVMGEGITTCPGGADTQTGVDLVANASAVGQMVFRDGDHSFLAFRKALNRVVGQGGYTVKVSRLL